MEDAIRCGGLAVTKASRIRSILKDVMERRGEICLEYLRALSVGEVKAELSRFKGIGPKTVPSLLTFLFLNVFGGLDLVLMQRNEPTCLSFLASLIPKQPMMVL